MKQRRHSTLQITVRDLRNFTGETLWSYDSSGAVIELRPVLAQVKSKDAYCITDAKIRGVDAEHTVTAVHIGTGREGQPIYDFFNADGVRIIKA